MGTTNLDNLTLGGNLVVTGTETITGGVTYAGDVTLGDAAGDTITITGTIGANVLVGTTKKIQWRDTGLYIYSSVDGQLDIVADTTLALSGAVTMDSTLTMGGKINLYPIGSAAASASGLLAGVGTTAAPATTATADAKFIEIRSESTATSGDSRGLYWRHALNGAGVSGETIRAFTKLTAAAANARGAHFSLDIDAGSASGLGAGVDAQILLGNAALTGGTYAVMNVEAYSAGSSTDVSGVTAFDIFRVSLGGDATGAATVDAKANLFNFAGVTAGAGNLIDTGITTHTAYGGIPVNIGGTIKYIALVSD